MITHDVELLGVHQQVFPLGEPCRASMSTRWAWQRYLQQRETDEKRRRREQLNAERKADQLFSQADKMRQGNQGHGRAQHGGRRRAATGRDRW